MSLHSFDPDVAQKVGINAAVIYQNLIFWTRKNLANGKNVHDDCVWTYNSVRAWSDLFPYLSHAQTRRALEKLVECGMVQEGNFNKSAYDRTKWYGVSTQIHLSKLANGNAGNDEPIPDSNTDSNTDVREDTNVSSRRKPSPYAGFDDFWDLWPSKKNKSAAKKAWGRLSIERKRLAYAAIRDGWFERWQAGSPAANPIHASSFLNGSRWDDEITQPTFKAINGGSHGQPASKSKSRMDAFIGGATAKKYAP